MALGTFTVLTASSSTANSGQTAPYSTASVTITSGRATFVLIVHSDAASEQDASGIQTAGGAIVFTKRTTVGYDTAAANTKKVEVWYVMPASTVTAAVEITLPDDGTGCGWVVAEITGAAATPVVGTDATGTVDAATSLAATHGALASANNYQLGVWGTNGPDNTDVPSGTDWTNIGNGVSYTTPAVMLEVAINTSGVAQQLTASGGGSLARGMIITEIAAATTGWGPLTGGRLLRGLVNGGFTS
jgi:hypothetical protein